MIIYTRHFRGRRHVISGALFIRIILKIARILKRNPKFGNLRNYKIIGHVISRANLRHFKGKKQVYLRHFRGQQTRHFRGRRHVISGANLSSFQGPQTRHFRGQNESYPQDKLLILNIKNQLQKIRNTFNTIFNTNNTSSAGCGYVDNSRMQYQKEITALNL